uniref:Uncharacterized protein n=1 Tax=viral metagenome TaxID=1070528 RepID=A0A6M3JG30_9ZZZZ
MTGIWVEIVVSIAVGFVVVVILGTVVIWEANYIAKGKWRS